MPCLSSLSSATSERVQSMQYSSKVSCATLDLYRMNTCKILHHYRISFFKSIAFTWGSFIALNGRHRPHELFSISMADMTIGPHRASLGLSKACLQSLKVLVIPLQESCLRYNTQEFSNCVGQTLNAMCFTMYCLHRSTNAGHTRFKFRKHFLSKIVSKNFHTNFTPLVGCRNGQFSWGNQIWGIGHVGNF